MKIRIGIASSILIIIILLAIILLNNKTNAEQTSKIKDNVFNTSNTKTYSNEIDTEERKKLEKEIEKANQIIEDIFYNQVSSNEKF